MLQVMTAKKRKKSLLTKKADEAARQFLLETLIRFKWNLSQTAEELELVGAPAVIAAIKSYGLAEEYEQAKKRGDVSPGRPTT